MSYFGHLLPFFVLLYIEWRAESWKGGSRGAEQDVEREEMRFAYFPVERGNRRDARQIRVHQSHLKMKLRWQKDHKIAYCVLDQYGLFYV